MNGKLTFFFSSFTSPETYNNKKMSDIPDWVSLYNNTFLWFLIHNDLMMMMAIEVCNLHDKVHTYYASKVGSKN